MDDVMKLTEQDFDDLIEAVGEWGKASPDTMDATAMILTNLISGEEEKEKIELMIKNKRIEFLQKKKQRERDKGIKPISLFMKKPRIRVVTLEQLKIMRHTIAGGTHASPIPHQRIGHWRTLKSEKFVNKRFKRIWINEMQVGDLSWSDEKTTYRVISQADQK